MSSKSADHQYYPERPDFKQPPKYSLGGRRSNDPGVLNNATSTPEAVGPATYMIEGATKLDKWKQASKWSFPQANRRDLSNKAYDRHQTYDKRESIGPQYISRKRTAPQHKFGNETREGRQKSGMFQSSMTQQQAHIRLPHPKF